MAAGDEHRSPVGIVGRQYPLGLVAEDLRSWMGIGGQTNTIHHCEPSMLNGGQATTLMMDFLDPDGGS